MNDRLDILAWLLAAEEHPQLKQEVKYLHAEEALHASEDLQMAFEEAKAFSEKHPRLIGFDALPGDARLRIAYHLKQAQKEARPVVLHPWSVRRQFAWAAVLVLFLGGLSMLSTTLVEKAYPPPPPVVARGPEAPPARRMDEFYRFVSHVVQEGAPIQHQGHQIPELVDWLRQNDGFGPELPQALLAQRGMGCSVIQGPHGKVSLVCVDVNGQRMNLFIGCARSLRREPAEPRRIVLENREVLEWVDEYNTYILVNEDPNGSMPEFLL